MRARASVSTILLLSMVMGLSSCMFFRKRATVQNNEPVTLEVVNNNWSDMIIYALVGGTRTRIGNVSASTSATLTLPITLVTPAGGLQLILDPLGSRSTFRTGQILVHSGQHVRLLIENEIRLTSWTVY